MGRAPAPSRAHLPSPALADASHSPPTRLSLPRPAGDDSGFTEGRTGVVTLNYRSDIVSKVCEYLMFKHRWTGSKEDPPDFQPRVQPEIALELYVQGKLGRPTADGTWADTWLVMQADG